MPIYEYRCEKCSARFEYLLLRRSETVVCPSCGSSALERLVSTFAFSSKDSHGSVTASSSGCSGCTSHNCASCGCH